MNWSNVKLIFAREVRDQLRDRRTLFMIAVLPILLYPLLGMSFFQVTQFLREHPARVLVIDPPQSDLLPTLVDGDYFAEDLFKKDSEQARHLLKVTEQASTAAASANALDEARAAMHAGSYDVVLYFPPDFAERYREFREELNRLQSAEGQLERSAAQVPQVAIFPNLARDSSRAAYARVADVLTEWRSRIGAQTLEAHKLPPTAAQPFTIATRDVAQQGQHRAAAWSKILPFVLLIWALTGAFYPAIDLCAGEKERGTLETLLSSPAERLEIVWGKLLTVMLFSMATAILNLSSLAITGSLVLSQIPNLGPPPTSALVWLVVALVPMSALFSALCLALAVLAKSTKEGQYYLMPLVLIAMPLVVLPMSPGVELNFGNSLIPVTGVVLLLRSLLEGQYLEVLPYAPVVVLVTLGCCLLAIRWATNQFNSEGVLFRESERWGVSLWLRHLVRDRAPTPSFAEAMFCGFLILVIKFFMGFGLSTPRSFADFVRVVGITQLIVIALPALLMAVLFTSSARQTLLIRRSPFGTPLAAAALAVAFHPLANLLQSIVARVYPLDDQVAKALNDLIFQPDSLWVLLLVIAVLPAVCEELAFRGFILSGLRHLGHKWTAIVVSSLFFGATHALFQQSIVAAIVGVLLGFVAVQSGSIWPCILFHAIHNSMAVLVQRGLKALETRPEWLDWLIHDADTEGPLYRWPMLVASAAVTAAILYWFHRLPYARTPEESLQEAIDHQSAHWLPG
jgi:sodium transport system permease protein